MRTTLCYCYDLFILFTVVLWRGSSGEKRCVEVMILFLLFYLQYIIPIFLVCLAVLKEVELLILVGGVSYFEFLNKISAQSLYFLWWAEWCGRCGVPCKFSRCSRVLVVFIADGPSVSSCAECCFPEYGEFRLYWFSPCCFPEYHSTI